MPYRDKEKRNEYLREWSAKNKEKCRKYTYEYQARHPDAKLLKSSKHNAKARGLEHTITREDILSIIPTHCPYLGIELTSKVESKNTPSTMSLDRIDSAKGYTKDNIQVISNLANLMKSFATEEQLVTFAKNVLRLHGTESEDIQ